MFCDQCGSKLINDNDKFCPYCGTKRHVIVPSVNQAEVNNYAIDNKGNNSDSVYDGYNETEPVTSAHPTSVSESATTEPAYVSEPVTTEPMSEPVTTEPAYVSEPVTTSESEHDDIIVNVVEPVHITEPVDFESAQSATSDPSSEIDITIALDKEIDRLDIEEPQEQLVNVPDEFILDPASGWYYKSRGKQLATGAYVNEITWFDPNTAKTTAVDYPLSEQQVRAMLANQAKSTQSANANQGVYGSQQANYQGQNQINGQNPNLIQGQYQNQGQSQNRIPNQGQYQGQIPNQGQYQNQNQIPNQGQYQGQIPNQGQYQNQAQYQTVSEPKKKSKTGLIIGIVATVLVLGLGFCTWKFEWYKIILGDKEKTASNIVPSATPSPTATLTPTPTPTPIPENPLGTLNEDYIVVGGQEFETTANTLYLDSMGLTNEDIESLQYMKDLKYLYISDNNITSLDAISGLTTLETLDASLNDIYDVSSLSNLTKLTSLYLDHTLISDLSPLTSLTSLSALGITYTQVYDLTPLVSLQSIMYLYVAEAPVYDYSPLSLMTNLYMCDVTYDTGNPTDPINPGINFEFTEDDNLYFAPLTDNYLIASIIEGSTDQMILFSYDIDGKCVQMRLRVDLGYDLNESNAEEYIGLLEESENFSNINYSGSVIYFDYPATEEEFSYTKEEILSQLEADNIQIIANVNEVE